MVLLDSVTLIFRLANELYEANEGVKHNKEESNSFIKYVRLVEKQLLALGEVFPEKVEFEEGIACVLRVLQEAVTVMTKHRNKAYVFKLMRYKSYQEELVHLKEKLRDGLELMGLCLNVEDAINQQKLLIGQERDHKELMRMKDEFRVQCRDQMEQGQKVLMAVGGLRVTAPPTDLINAVVEKQVESMLSTFKLQLDGVQGQLLQQSPTRNYPIIRYHDLKFVSLISSSELGGVWRGSWDSTPVVIKTVTDPGIQQNSTGLQKELGILCGLVHPNIVRCFGWPCLCGIGATPRWQLTRIFDYKSEFSSRETSGHCRRYTSRVKLPTRARAIAQCVEYASCIADT